MSKQRLPKCKEEIKVKYNVLERFEDGKNTRRGVFAYVGAYTLINNQYE